MDQFDAVEAAATCRAAPRRGRSAVPEMRLRRRAPSPPRPCRWRAISSVRRGGAGRCGGSTRSGRQASTPAWKMRSSASLIGALLSASLRSSTRRMATRTVRRRVIVGLFRIVLFVVAVPADLVHRGPGARRDPGQCRLARTGSGHHPLYPHQRRPHLDRHAQGQCDHGLAALCAARASARSALRARRPCRHRLRQSRLLSEHADLGGPRR